MQTTFKRKYRWTIQAELPGGKIEEMFVKVSARPSWEPSGEHQNIPGKTEWKSIAFTAYEMDATDKDRFWNVVESNHCVCMLDCPTEKLGNYTLKLYDGCGCLIESWLLKDAYIYLINFMEYSESSSEPIDIELNVNYKNAEWKNHCDGKSPYEIIPNKLGMGMMKVSKVRCPKCQHEFIGLPDPSIVF